MRHGKIDKNTARGLKVLRQRIQAADIPSSSLDESFNLATWNIREFGKKARSDSSIHYIAEILNQFDLIAVTELRDNLGDLQQVMRILGPYWSVVYSDFITDAGGNRERVGYLFDKRALVFTGLASEADPARKKNAKTGQWVSDRGWWRSPYMASFRAGSFDFVLLAVHIRWGKKLAEREEALRLLAEWVHARRLEKHVIDKDFIVLGDFNVPSTKPSDKMFAAITSKGLRVPDALAGPHGSNLAKNKRYDQILHYPATTGPDTFTNNGGVLDFYAGDHKALYPGQTLTKTRFTYELSDHLPLWIQIDCDTAGEELDQILGGKKK